MYIVGLVYFVVLYIINFLTLINAMVLTDKKFSGKYPMNTISIATHTSYREDRNSIKTVLQVGETSIQYPVDTSLATLRRDTDVTISIASDGIDSRSSISRKMNM